MNINSTKPELRRALLAKRNQLDPVDVTRRSKILAEKLFELVKENYKVHCFLPLADDNEPDLRVFIGDAMELGAQVYTSDPDSRKVLYPDHQLVKGRLKQYKLGNNMRFDLIVVPMLGFYGKHRLGFGGGFYDKFLATQPNAQKIGVCFKEFKLENLPVENHDQMLDKILVV